MQKKLWFTAKRYGWGWQPASWEGWLILAVYIVIITDLSLRIDPEASSGREEFLSFFLPMLFFTSVLIFICWRTGERPRWRWGGK